MTIKYYENNVLKSRDMTPEEIAEWEQSIADTPAPEPTTEERITALESTTDDIILMMADLIGGA